MVSPYATWAALLLDHQESDSRFHLTFWPVQINAQWHVTRAATAVSSHRGATKETCHWRIPLHHEEPQQSSFVVLSSLYLAPHRKLPKALSHHDGNAVAWPCPNHGHLQALEIKANLATELGEKERHVTQHSACLQCPQLADAASALSTCQVTYLLYKMFLDSFSLFCTCRASNWSKYKLAKSSKLHATPSACSTSVAIGRSIPSNLMAKSSTINLGGLSLDPGQPTWQTHRVAQGILDLDASGQGRAMWFKTTSTMTSTPEIRI